MALKADAKEKLKTFGLDVDKLIAAITDTAEVDFPVPADITVIKTADLETRDSNNKASGKVEGETIGVTKGRELAAKAFRKKFSLEDTVGNDVDKVVEAVHAKVNKGDAGLQEQITLLQSDKQRLETEKLQLEQRAKDAGFDAELISYFPANRTGDLSDAERLALVKMNLKFEEYEGKAVVKKNGEILRDKATQAPLTAKDVVATLFAEKKWVQTGTGGEGGRGGGDNPPGGGGAAGVKKRSAFLEKWRVENPGADENGPDAVDALGKHAKDIPDFDWHN